jgi:hypothetical protein
MSLMMASSDQTPNAYIFYVHLPTYQKMIVMTALPTLQQLLGEILSQFCSCYMQLN